MSDFTEKVNPEMISLARQSRGLTQIQLAQQLSTTAGLLSKIESGIRYITATNLDRLTVVLNYPIEFFHNKEPLSGFGISEMYHRKRQSVSNRTLDKIHAQINIIRMSIIKMLRGVDIGESEFLHLDVDEFDGNILKIARAARAMWHVPRGPIRNLTKIIEYARGIVIPFDFGTKHIDAISYWPKNSPPLFFIDIDVPGDRLRFSLCHELGHVIMHQNYPFPDIENQAYVFAAEFLMPEKEIRSHLVDPTLEKLALLKPHWRVSMAALLKRASDLGTITPRRARTLWAQMAKVGIKNREPVELDVPAEIPSLLKEIVSTHSNEMEFSLSDLAKMLTLPEKDVCRYFFGLPDDLHQNELDAAIEEAENIIKAYQGGKNKETKE